MSTCKYCNIEGLYGAGCNFSPHGKHEHNDTKKCVFCGTEGLYGPGCSFSPLTNGVHAHGPGGSRCRYCGIEGLYGPGCSFSPHGGHER